MTTAMQPLHLPTVLKAEADNNIVMLPPSATSMGTPRTMLTDLHDDSTTPTRPTFTAEAMSQQKPLPDAPFPQTAQETIHATPARRRAKREDSQQSRLSKESDDVDMLDSDDETAGGEGDISDGDESVDGDGNRSSRKRKSQRFYCTEYPPCNLSFTRSEHLARHIRKHTGERPFQCHCSRRFSRLDNLRQHAQTVHLNEDIPNDSLAASGIRFQRQIRTERVRPNTGNARARAGTAGSTGSAGRGHSKSHSTSSITSVSSIGSSLSTRDDVRRRPPPLVMADPRARLSTESYHHSDGSGQYAYRSGSPVDYSAPSSATYAPGGSPRWSHGVVSPMSAYSRTQGMYSNMDQRTPARRLSVPSGGGNPFHSPSTSISSTLSRPLFPTTIHSYSGDVTSPRGSALASPAFSNSSWVRRDSSISAVDEAWRRRTWGGFPNGASRLSQVITPSQMSPSIAALPEVNREESTAQQLRLPGIASFDPLPPRNSSPIGRRSPSPMLMDVMPSLPPSLLPSARLVEDTRVTPSTLQTSLTRLELGNSAESPHEDGAGRWAAEVYQAVPGRSSIEPPLPRYNTPAVRFDPELSYAPPPLHPAESRPLPTVARGHQHTVSAPIASMRTYRRHAWYDGPTTVHEGRVLESRLPHLERMDHPNLATFTGFPAREQHGGQVPPAIHSQPSLHSQARDVNDPSRMGRLEALVAVATSEGSTAKAY